MLVNQIFMEGRIALIAEIIFLSEKTASSPGMMAQTRKLEPKMKELHRFVDAAGDEVNPHDGARYRVTDTVFDATQEGGTFVHTLYEMGHAAHSSSFNQTQGDS